MTGVCVIFINGYNKTKMKLTSVIIHLTLGGGICLYHNPYVGLAIIFRDGAADHNGGAFKCLCSIGEWYRLREKDEAA